MVLPLQFVNLHEVSIRLFSKQFLSARMCYNEARSTCWNLKESKCPENLNFAVEFDWVEWIFSTIFILLWATSIMVYRLYWICCSSFNKQFRNWTNQWCIFLTTLCVRARKIKSFASKPIIMFFIFVLFLSLFSMFYEDMCECVFSRDSLCLSYY